MVSSVVSPIETPIEAFGNDRPQVWQQLLRSNGAVFVGSYFSLLSSEKNYRVSDNNEIVDRDRLTDT